MQHQSKVPFSETEISKAINPSRSTYYSSIYREFRSIDPAERRTMIRFYELYEDKMEGLDFEESFDMLLAYANALFEVGDHQKHLIVADQVLEVSVMNNVKFFNGEDVFQKTLFQKAASNYNCHELERSDYILREILRIDPYDHDSAVFLKKCLREMRSNLRLKTRAFAMLLLIGGAFILCFELLFVRSLHTQSAGMVALVRNFVLGLSISSLAFGELYHRLRCHREVDNFVEHLKARKKEVG